MVRTRCEHDAESSNCEVQQTYNPTSIGETMSSQFWGLAGRPMSTLVHSFLCVTPNHFNQCNSVRYDTSLLYSSVRTPSAAFPPSQHDIPLAFLPVTCAQVHHVTRCQKGLLLPHHACPNWPGRGRSSKSPTATCQTPSHNNFKK